jgi:hypothetical protein
MPSPYSINTIFTIFHVFDACGRYFTKIFTIPKKGFYIIAYSRIILLITCPLVVAASKREWINVFFEINFRILGLHYSQ